MMKDNGGENWHGDIPLKFNVNGQVVDASYKLRIMRPIFLNADGTLDIPCRGRGNRVVRHICTVDGYSYAHMHLYNKYYSMKKLKEMYVPRCVYTEKAKKYCIEQGIPYVPRNDVPSRGPSSSRMPKKKSRL